jgi:hypothetical protein
MSWLKKINYSLNGGRSWQNFKITALLKESLFKGREKGKR